MAEPVKGVAYVFPVPLADIADPQLFLVNPTIESGDFKISKDFGSFVNLATLPTVQPAGSRNVRINLTAVEMTADKIVVEAHDQVGEEWGDVSAFIDAPAANLDNVADLLEGDHTETNAKIVIRKKGTATIILDKKISGSLLPTGVTIATTEP